MRKRRRARGGGCVDGWWAVAGEGVVGSAAAGGSWHGAGCGRRKEEEVGVVFVLVGWFLMCLCHVFIHV